MIYKRLYVSAILFFLVYSPLVLNAQNVYSIDKVIEKVLEHYPASKQKDYIESLGEQNRKILESNLLPRMSVSGQATYQSEVTKFSFPGIEGPKQDNYQIGLELRMPLTEFDIEKQRKKIIEERTSAGKLQVETDLQKLKERVAAVYGNLILLNENKKILQVRLSDLDNQRKKISSAVNTGMTLKSNLLVIESEILSTEQKIIDLDHGVKSFLSELSLLSGLDLSSSDQFLLSMTTSLQKDVNRPESMLFQTQMKLYDMQNSLLKKENRAKFFFFGQGFYGRPGYNFLNNNLRTYGLAGIGVNWNINNLITQKMQSKSNDLNREILARQQETFNLNLNIVLSQKKFEIEKYEPIIQKDEEIVSKRRTVLEVFSSQLENGFITSTEYITELNAENAAEMNMQLHRVQREMAKIQYNTLTGH
ncbi:MAG: TolC family protein [Chitinophagaceae bacterium]